MAASAGIGYTSSINGKITATEPSDEPQFDWLSEFFLINPSRGYRNRSSNQTLVPPHRSRLSTMLNFSLLTLLQMVTLCGASLVAFRFGYWPFIIAMTVSGAFVATSVLSNANPYVAIGATRGIIGSLIGMIVDYYLRQHPPIFVTNFEYQSMFLRSVLVTGITLVSAAILGAIVAMLLNYASSHASTSTA